MSSCTRNTKVTKATTIRTIIKMFKFLTKKREEVDKKLPKDPVCGMPSADGITYEHDGKTYHFCSDHCQRQFANQPEKYI